MDEPAVGLMPSSSVIEDSRALGIDVIDGGRLEEEQQITQNTTSVTMRVETTGTISQTSGSVEIEVPDEEVVRKAGHNLISPKVGMTFQYEEEAYEMYTEDSTIRCSCRMFESIGLLCKHALRVLNTNRVYNLPSQYILPRWTKYAKTGFYIEKQGTEKGDLKTQATLISRQATSLALKCSPSQELLDKLQKAIHNLNLEADTYLSEMHEKSNEVPAVPIQSAQDALNGVISFKIPQVIKGPKNTHFKNVVEMKSSGKKKKGAHKKGEDLETNDVETRDGRADPNQITNFNDGPSSSMDAPFLQGGHANSTMTHFNLIPEPSAMFAPYISGGYTSLLMGFDQDATVQNAVRKLYFHGVQE